LRWDATGSEKTFKRVESSANKKRSEITDKSLINMINKLGSSTEPWGTPADVLIRVDDMPFNTTHCFLLDKYDLNHSKRQPHIPKDIPSLCIKPRCHTLSKALQMSRKTVCTSTPYSKADRNISLITISWFTVESPA
jgi:hypothetical protein